jgi:SAM-dependent methyltransferase
VNKTWSFDSELTQNYTRVRQVFISEFLDRTRGQVSLESALDVGCGVGHFSKFLSERGFRVVALDGREGNVREGKRRYPEIDFLTGNAEDLPLSDLGTFDFVLCVGLLYHLENPFRAIRNLYSLTGKILFVESMCAPGNDPKLQLLDESDKHDQGLNSVAFYPTEACLVKMLYRAGFPFVYGFETLPNHTLFHASWWRRKERTLMLASKYRLNTSGLRLAPDIQASMEILSTPGERWAIRFRRLLGLVRKLRQQASRPQDIGKA